PPGPVEPQPETRVAAAPCSASTEAPRRWLVMRDGCPGPLVTVAQPNGLGRCVYQRCAIELGSLADRARRGGSGALYPQSALAGLNSSPRDSAPVAPSLAASMARVPRGAGLRPRS